MWRSQCKIKGGNVSSSEMMCLIAYSVHTAPKSHYTCYTYPRKQQQLKALTLRCILAAGKRGKADSTYVTIFGTVAFKYQNEFKGTSQATTK